MTNDCQCDRCRAIDRRDGWLWQVGERVQATGRVYRQDGSVATKRGTPGVIEDIDVADRWLIVAFPGEENVEICFGHEVRGVSPRPAGRSEGDGDGRGGEGWESRLRS